MFLQNVGNFLPGAHGVTSLKTVFFIFTTLRTSHLIKLYYWSYGETDVSADFIPS
jgi:hypothetical protein